MASPVDQEARQGMKRIERVRREHWRTQRHGPERSLSRRIRIALCRYRAWVPDESDPDQPDLPFGDGR